MEMAEQEGAETARRGRARGSNLYPVNQDVILRQHWFLGYDQAEQYVRWRKLRDHANIHRVK